MDTHTQLKHFLHRAHLFISSNHECNHNQSKERGVMIK